MILYTSDLGCERAVVFFFLYYSCFQFAILYSYSLIALSIGVFSNSVLFQSVIWITYSDLGSLLNLVSVVFNNPQLQHEHQYRSGGPNGNRESPGLK